MRKNFLLLGISLIVSLLVCEAITRFIRPISDIVPMDPIKCPVLGHRLHPYQSGHDKYGYRNETAEGVFPLVFIGDSLTYGNGVPRSCAIPQQLSKLINKKVYNMALGAYGPIQYYQLLKNSIALQPEKTIIAFYLGNDLLDCYFLAERLDHWKWLIKEVGDAGNFNEIKPCPLSTGENIIEYYEPDVITIRMRKSGSAFWKLHNFLRLNSALYGLQYEVFTKPLMKKIFEQQKYLECQGAFYSPHIDTIFTPDFNLSDMNINDARVRKGLLITKKIIELIKDYSKNGKKNNEVIFTIVPTKENVYYNRLKHYNVTLPPNFTCAVYYEREISKWLRGVIERNGFVYLDVFPELESSANKGNLLYHSYIDAHLNALGCQTVAKAIFTHLR